MGYQLVGAVLSPTAPQVSDRARLILARMALVALDEPQPNRPARRYFGGHESLAIALYGVDRDSPEWETCRKRISRAMAELEEAGAVRPVRRASYGHRAVYEVFPVDDCG